MISKKDLSKGIEIYLGDCRDILKELPDNFVDSVVTDPPYELGFMNKAWDSTGIAYDVSMWKEVLRVLKPGGHLLSFGGTRTYHRMACAIEDAGFEIRDQIQWIYGCLSEDTECLTKNGWKYYNELTLDDFVLQWDGDTNNLSWCHPNDIFIYEAPKEMIHLYSRHTDQLITKNHRVYGKFLKHSRNEKPNKYSVENAGDIKKHWRIDIPMAGVLYDGNIVQNLAYIIGWWMTDAWVHNDKKACMFSQCKPLFVDKLRNTLSKLDCNFSEYVKVPRKDTHSAEHTFYVTGKLSEFLLNNFPDRKITYDILSWDYESRFQLLEGLLDGDGSRPSYAKYEVFWSKDRERLDIVQMLCISLNIRNYIDYKKGCVYMTRNKNSTQLSYYNDIEEIPYDGKKVWCINVDNHAFVARRNGKPFITGNSGFPKSLNISKAIDKRLGLEREIIGKDKYSNRGAIGIGNTSNGGASIDEREKSKEIRGLITLPASEESERWEGWGSCLKPTHEPICLARKPISEKTIVDNVLKWGVGGLNIDKCRIELNGEIVPINKLEEWSGFGQQIKPDYVQEVNNKGRYPANVILDEDAGKMLDEQSGITKSSNAIRKNTRGWGDGNIYGTGNAQDSFGFSDKGGASRFFYCAKSSKREKNKYLTEQQKNIHTTVKPITLMEYLCNLITPIGGIILDPFMGSGTTGIACVTQNFKFIGIEKENEYFDIAKKRIFSYAEEEE